MSKKILIIDDSPDNVMLIGFLLKKTGHEVLSANESEEAFEIINNTPPDLILLDLYMPDTTGKEICQRLKKSELFKNIPIILQTAGEDELVDELLSTKMVDDYIKKPVQTEELINKTNLLLNKN